MPFYDYRCAACGDFRERRPMIESREPQPCPACRVPCTRRLSAPFLAGADAGVADLGPTGSRDGSYARWRSTCGFGCRSACCSPVG